MCILFSTYVFYYAIISRYVYSHVSTYLYVYIYIHNDIQYRSYSG